MTKLLVRVAGLGVMIAAIFGVIQLVADAIEGETGLGVGLIAFVLLSIVSVGWAFADTRVGKLHHALILWGITAMVVAVGWVAAMSMIEASLQEDFGELFRENLSLIPFLAALIFIPAGFGALLGLSRPKTPARE